MVLAATWWLYRSEVANHVEITIPAPTWAGDDELAQVKQALQQEHDKTEKLARELTTDLAQVKQVLQQERDKTEKLASESGRGPGPGQAGAAAGARQDREARP